jgi:hypothetical protein
MTDKVTPPISDEEKALRDEIVQSESQMDSLEQKLKDVSGELDAFSGKGQEIRVLAQVCGSLEELQQLGASKLFWGEQSDSSVQEQHLQIAQQSIDAFAAEVAKVEERRETILGKIGNHNEQMDVLAYDLKDLMAQEERSKAEWIVENDEHDVAYRSQIMPWARGGEEDQRFRRSLVASIAACLLIGLLSQIVDIPIPERAELIKVPERVVRLIREERAEPPPPVVVEERFEPEEPDVEPEPMLVEELPDEVAPVQTQDPVVADVPQPDTREQVKSKGILAFRESFAGRAMTRPTAQLGANARVSTAGGDAVGRPERSMVTTSAPGSSGGINLSNISRDVGTGGGGGIGGVDVIQATSSIGGGDGPDRPLSGGMSAGRTDEEIQIVFDRYKSALYRLYNRELRKDPTLRGQLVLRLTIEANGSVSLCQLQSTDMNAPALADQVVTRVGSFDFGAKEDIGAITIIYPIDFLPAA